MSTAASCSEDSKKKQFSDNCLDWTSEKFSPFIDYHFLFPIFEWSAKKYEALGKTESANRVNEKYFTLLSKTYMTKKIQSLSDILKKDNVLEDIVDKAQKHEKEIAALEESTHSFIKALFAYKKEQQLRISGVAERRSSMELCQWWIQQKPKNPNNSASEDAQIEKDYKPFSATVDDEMLRMAKLLYESGMYVQSKKILDLYLRLVAEYTYEGMSMTKKQSCYWGIACAVIQNMLFDSMSQCEPSGSIKSLASESAKNNEYVSNENEEEEDKELFDSIGPEVAGCCLIKLNELLESNDNGNRMTRDKFILMRSWILHWLLFPLFKHFISSVHNKNSTPVNKVWGQLPDLLLDEKSLSVINLVAPHLFRYLAVSAILNRKRKDHFQIILNSISNVKCKYSDSFTSLLESLFVYFDFDAAQKHMIDVAQTCDEDYFLDGLSGAIEEHCRLLIFETYCRIHKSINIDLIAKKVNMTPDAAERWIVNLIRHAKLEAKIDSEKNRVEMSSSSISLYQQVIERTRNIGIRTSMLLQNLCRPLNNTNQFYLKNSFSPDLDLTINNSMSVAGNKYRNKGGRPWTANRDLGGMMRGEARRFDKNKNVRNFADEVFAE